MLHVRAKKYEKQRERKKIAHNATIHRQFLMHFSHIFETIL